MLGDGSADAFGSSSNHGYFIGQFLGHAKSPFCFVLFGTEYARRPLAAKVFLTDWYVMMLAGREGYEGTSLADLTEAMGINRPSMYATFGNKETLFRKALDRYEKLAANCRDEGLEEPTARGAVEKILLGSADALSEPGHPRGCLMVQGALTCGDESDAVRRELRARRAAGEAAIRERLERAKAEGDLPAEADAAELAGYVTTVL